MLCSRSLSSQPRPAAASCSLQKQLSMRSGRLLPPVKAQPDRWHALDQPLLWQGSEEEALTASLPSRLSPPWKVRNICSMLVSVCESLADERRLQVILLSDGSVTRHLQLMTGLKIKVVRL